jgi:AraC-like DNA-binding protein
MNKIFRKAIYRVKFTGADAPLPFSVRSAGHYQLDCDSVENQGGRRFVQFFWSIRGKGQVVVNDQEFVIDEQQAFYYLPEEDHVLQAFNAPWEYRWFTFDGPMAEALMRGFQYPRGPFFAGKCPEDLFETLEKRIHDATITEMRNLTAVAWQILAAAGAGERAVGREEKLLQNFFELVRENYANESVNINAMSDLLQVHRSTLTRVISKHTGMTPGVYLYDFRLRKALEMLRLTDIPAGDVAAACGIPDQCYFSKVIRRAVNCTPITYRKLYRNQ